MCVYVCVHVHMPLRTCETATSSLPIVIHRNVDKSGIFILLMLCNDMTEADLVTSAHLFIAIQQSILTLFAKLMGHQDEPCIL